MSNKLDLIVPGEILLEEFLKPKNISQNQLAKDIQVPPGRINQIINGKREITADTALRLSVYFGMEAEFWMNLQTSFNLRKAKRNITKILSSIKLCVRKSCAVV